MGVEMKPTTMLLIISIIFFELGMFIGFFSDTHWHLLLQPIVLSLVYWLVTYNNKRKT